MRSEQSGEAARGLATWLQGLAAVCGVLWAGTAVAAERPNVLWLVAEDFGPELACYGTAQVDSPNLDKLAAEGVRFTRAYSTAPVCSASRSAFMTGMYQTTIGAHNHRSHRDDGWALPAGVRVLPDWLRDHGYYTANVVALPADCGFKGSGKTDWNFSYHGSAQAAAGDAQRVRPGKPFDGADWSELKSRQPFFAQLNFQETHRKFHAPKKADPDKVKLPPYYPDHPIARADWAEYLDSATELDRKIGKVLAQLAADGLAENTIVVFCGDHGQAHVRGKQFCYEEGLHIPLMVRWPKNDKLPAPAGFKPGTVDDRLVEAIDVAPTILAFAGAAKPERMQGRILWGPNAGPDREYAFGARDRCDETVFRLRTVRDGRYRYIRNFTPDRPFLQANDYKERSYPVWNLLKELAAQDKLTPAQKFLTAPTMPSEELYDLHSDPHEIHNLALSESPEHKAALARLRGVLNSWIEETGDLGKDLEPASVAAAKGLTKAKPGEGNPNAAAGATDVPVKPKAGTKKAAQ